MISHTSHSIVKRLMTEWLRGLLKRLNKLARDSLELKQIVDSPQYFEISNSMSMCW